MFHVDMLPDVSRPDIPKPLEAPWRGVRCLSLTVSVALLLAVAAMSEKARFNRRLNRFVCDALLLPQAMYLATHLPALFAGSKHSPNRPYLSDTDTSKWKRVQAWKRPLRASSRHHGRSIKRLESNHANPCRRRPEGR